MEKTEASFSSLANFAAANLGAGLKEHAAPIFLMPYSPRPSPIDALRESWIIVAGSRWWTMFALTIVGALFSVFAQILGRIIFASVAAGDFHVSAALAAACAYAGAILTILFGELVATAAAAAWTLPANE
jgi:hypothetical protein